MAQEVFKQLNWVDVIVIILLIRGAYVGFHAGLTDEFFNLIGYLVASVLSIHFYTHVSDTVSFHVHLPQEVAEVLSFLAVWMAVSLLFKLMRWLLQQVVKVQFTKRLERPGGIVLGVVRASVVASLVLVTLVLTQIAVVQRHVTEESLIGQHLVRIAPTIYNLAKQIAPSYGVENDVTILGEL